MEHTASSSPPCLPCVFWWKAPGGFPLHPDGPEGQGRVLSRVFRLLETVPTRSRPVWLSLERFKFYTEYLAAFYQSSKYDSNSNDLSFPKIRCRQQMMPGRQLTLSAWRIKIKISNGKSVPSSVVRYRKSRARMTFSIAVRLNFSIVAESTGLISFVLILS